MQYRCLGLAGPQETDVLRRGAEAYARSTRKKLVLEPFARREDLLYRIRDGGYDAVLVALPGALGMESAMGVRAQDRSVPLIWISDDEVFALESYRLRVTLFLCLPVTTEQVTDALARCLA